MHLKVGQLGKFCRQEAKVLTELMNKRLQELAGKDQIVKTFDLQKLFSFRIQEAQDSGLDVFGGFGEDVDSTL